MAGESHIMNAEQRLNPRFFGARVNRVEDPAFDHNAVPQASMFLDSLLPLAADIPDIEAIQMETSSPFNPTGSKGPSKENMRAIAALTSTVEDVLRSVEVRKQEPPSHRRVLSN